MSAWIIAVPVAAGLFWLAYEYWQRSPEALYDKRYRELRDDMRRRGLAPEQMQQEERFRLGMARLRRRLSEAVLADPSTARQRLKEIVGDEAALISDRSVKRRFAEVATKGPIEDALYPDALKALRKYDATTTPRRRKITEDDIAAVTTN